MYEAGSAVGHQIRLAFTPAAPAGGPSAGLSQLCREDHAVPEPEREPDCPRHILSLECFPVAALQQVVALRLLADEMCSDRMTLDIVKGERRSIDRGGVRGPGYAPG